MLTVYKAHTDCSPIALPVCAQPTRPTWNVFTYSSTCVCTAYKAHTDCVPDGTDLRDRVATVLVYLDDVHDGGETKFPGELLRPDSADRGS